MAQPTSAAPSLASASSCILSDRSLASSATEAASSAAACQRRTSSRDASSAVSRAWLVRERHHQVLLPMRRSKGRAGGCRTSIPLSIERLWWLRLMGAMLPRLAATCKEDDGCQVVSEHQPWPGIWDGGLGMQQSHISAHRWLCVPLQQRAEAATIHPAICVQQESTAQPFSRQAPLP